MRFHSDIYNKYALCCAAFCLAVFVFLGAKSLVASIISAFIVLLLLPVLFLIRGEAKYYCRIAARVLLCTLAGIFVAAYAHCVYYLPSVSFLSQYRGKSCELLAEIESIASAGETYANYNAKIIAADGKSVKSAFGVYPTIRITDFSGDKATSGDVVKFTADISAPCEISDSGFRERQYLESQYIFVNCTVETSLKLVAEKQQSFLQRIREKMSLGISEYVGKYTDGYEAAFSRCMLLGDKSGVDGYLKGIFRASGISHILSVSGLHLSILLYTVSFILGIGKNKKRRRFPGAETISCILALAYMFVANFTPSIMRAGFMLIIANIFEIYKYYSRKFARPGIINNAKYEPFNSLSSLFGAIAVICLISPYSLYDIGMQLSFMSTLGIVLVMPVYKKYEQRYIPLVLRPIVSTLLITLCALSFTFPVCAYNFGTLSSMSALSNLFVTPIVTPLLALLLLLALLSLLPQSFIAVFICSVLGKICGFLATLCLKIAEMNSSFVLSEIRSDIGFALIVIFAVLVILATALLILRYEKLSVLFCGFTAALFLACFAVSFAESAYSRATPVLAVSATDETSYVCARVWDKRVFFDNSDALLEEKLIKEALSDGMYKTENIYCVCLDKNSDLQNAYFNIELFGKECGIEKILLPSRSVCERLGADIGKYDLFVKMLLDKGYVAEFYEKEFSVGNTGFAFKTEKEFTQITFSEYSIVFADMYSESIADRVSENSSYCVYFCNSTPEAEAQYDGNAHLYVALPRGKAVDGANMIAQKKITVLQ